MICPNCQTETNEGRRFCGRCGAALGTVERRPSRNGLVLAVCLISTILAGSSIGWYSRQRSRAIAPAGPDVSATAQPAPPTSADVPDKGKVRVTPSFDSNALPRDWALTSKLTLKGFGPLRIGTPLSQVKSVIGLAKDQDFSTPTCSVLELAGIPHGLSIMVTNGQVSRLDITSREYATLRGARVGMAEEQLKRLYPNELTMGYDKYNQSGRYFTFVPKDVVDQNFRMVFVTDGKQVTSFRTGKLPEIEYVEGCL